MSDLRRILLYGESGTGKTTSLATLLRVEGLRVAVLSTERNTHAGLKAGLEIFKIPEEFRKRLFVTSVTESRRGISTLINQAKEYNTKSDKVLMKSDDLQRNKYDHFLNILKGLENFSDELGPVDTWGDDTVLCVDGLSPIIEAIRFNLVGGKLAISPGEWNKIQQVFLNFVKFITEETSCHLVVLGHPVRQVDEVTKRERIFPTTPGVAIQQTIPGKFTDVIYAERLGQKFQWATAHNSAVSIGRNLPLSAKLEPDFSPIFK